jgi:hypothetical protein
MHADTAVFRSDVMEKDVRKVIPYTTPKGIQIGSRYTPPQHRITPEEETVQLAMLGVRRPMNPLAQVVLQMVAICFGAFLLIQLIKWLGI